MRSASVCFLTLAATACSRQLDVPLGKPLAFDTPTLTAAPRETVVLTATGGRQPYRFQFAPAGQGSGSDASIDASSGRYQAGSVGPAIDQLQVLDSGGAAASARVSVGPTLVAFPPVATVAPGGKVPFVVTGGKPPYALTAASGAVGTVQGTTYAAPLSGSCAAPPFAGASVALTLSDATGNASLGLTVNVTTGLDLRPAAGTGAVAPSDTLALFASGGQPPYVQYKITGAGSGSPSVDASGTYHAGLIGGQTDTVQVTDSNGQQHCLDLHVGAQLSAALSSSDVRPSSPLLLVASGGRPPYSFGFAFKGNRSFGSIDAITGAYLPGPNAGATDKLLVSDATGAPAVQVIAQLGARRLELGQNVFSLHVADLDGDRRDDLLVSDNGSVLTVSLSRAGAPITQYVNGPVVFALADVLGNGRTDLIARGPLAWMAQPDGSLIAPAQSAGTSTSFASSSIAAYAQTIGGASVTRLVGRGFAQSAVCSPPGQWLSHADWPIGAAAPGPVVCDKAVSGAMTASGDFNGDGVPDVAYNNTSVGTVLMRFGQLDGSWNATEQVFTPGRIPFPASVDQRGRPNFHTARPLGANADDLLVMVNDSATDLTKMGIAVLQAGASGTPPVYHLTPGGYPMSNFAVFTPRPGAAPLVVAVTGVSGDIAIYSYPFTVDPPVPLPNGPAPRAALVEEVRLADLDGDLFPSLVMGNHLLGQVEILGGEGDGTFGRRPHFAFSGIYNLGPDVDGDGAGDILIADAHQNVSTLFSSEHQLAQSPPTQMPEPAQAAALLDLDGDGIPDLIYASDAGHLFFARGRLPRDGTWAVPQAIQITWPGSAGAALPPVYYPQRMRFTDPTQHGLFVWMNRPVPNTFASRVGALLFSDATHASLYQAPKPGNGLVDLGGCPADIDGDGIEDLVVSNADSSGNQVISYSLVKPGDPPSATWPFRPWVSLPVTPVVVGLYLYSLGPVRPQGAPEGCGFIDFSNFPPTYYFVDVNGLHPTTLGPIDLNSWAPLVDIDGDGKPDLVVQSSDNVVHIYRGDGSGGVNGTEALSLPVLGNFSGVLPQPGGFGDLVTSTPDALIVIPNDGTGHF